MSAAMKLDADLPPLPPLLPGAESTFTMRCLTDDALRAIQREAFQAGMLKASLTHSTPPQGELSAAPELPKPWQDRMAAHYAKGNVLCHPADYFMGQEIADWRAYGLLCRQSGDAADKRDAWISVDDQLPSAAPLSNGDTPVVLVSWKRARLASNLSEIDVCNAAYLAAHKDQYTHWQPLPEPPIAAMHPTAGGK